MAQPVSNLDSIIKRRGFIWRSFEIYGGAAGFYDYGPMGTAMKNNILKVWRKYFIQREGFAEVDTPNLTPYEVFKASGHLEKFNDLLLECTQCGSLYKAEGMFSEYYPDISRDCTIDTLEPGELETLIGDKGVVCPECRGQFKSPVEFNLMFRTITGRDKVAYLHPETAQGIFVNFRNLYSYHREKLPFGAVQIGKGFRNEISPRQGVIRLREFNMAEAEVFIDPEQQDFPKFNDIKNSQFTLYDHHGAVHYLTAEEAVEEGIICHKALVYYMAITRDFLLEIGIDNDKLRFRQHLQDEMAHYAEDCWDAEILMEINGKESWIECVGIANRSCYDLEQHMHASGQDLRAYRRLDEPVEHQVNRIRPNLPLIGRTFKHNSQIVRDHLVSLHPPFPDTIMMDLDGVPTKIDPEMFSIELVSEKVTGSRFIPAVIEPSFGIDRILYALLQHSYNIGKSREGVDSDNYNILKLSADIAPLKAAIFPLFDRPGMTRLAMEIHASLTVKGITTAFDVSGSIGKRYARMDEVGTPYCITVDHESLEDATVTIRDRDSTAQFRIPVSSVSEILSDLLSGSLDFQELSGK